MRGRGGAVPGDGPEAVDHPRACGEEYQLNLGERVVLGSPPRVRGRVIVNNDRFANIGITPAYAGKRTPSGPRSSSARDHPRMCGEELQGIIGALQGLGSPPRMRGRAAPFPVHTSIPRITPACAGKRQSRCLSGGWLQDHPRVRGEEDIMADESRMMEGSPPRARGRGSRKADCPVAHRITPAYAGKSCWCINSFLSRQDHPRVCGEEKPVKAPIPPVPGSPPRMRGRESDFPGSVKRERITPAYAGKSTLSTPFCQHGRDHPRVCGEESENYFCRVAFCGITPAYAGKRQKSSGPSAAQGDHPRVCGEEA